MKTARAALSELLAALENLMAWQVKNVKVWHNSAWDDAHAALSNPKEQSK